MGFAKFTVLLYPTERSPLSAGHGESSFQSFVREVLESYDDLRIDTVEAEDCFPPKPSTLEILISESERGTFQVYLSLGSVKPDEIRIAVKFAYCNPVTVYSPLIEFIEWAMRTYRLRCEVNADLAPHQAGISNIVLDPSDLERVLLPSIHFNREIWRADFGTAEEPLRPGEAIAKFVTPGLIDNTKQGG